MNSPEFVQDHAGGDRTDANSLCQELAPETVNKRLDSMFGGAIHRLPVNRLVSRDRAADKNIPASLCQHSWQHCMNGIHDAFHIDVDQVRPIAGQTVSHVTRKVDSGVRKQSVNSPIMPKCRLHHLLY